MSKVLTALQPSGVLHIGNYFGAIEPFVKLQDSGNTNVLFVVDYHAITVPQEPEMLRKNIMFATATYLAAGVDPKKTLLFQQSHVPQHTELAWILNCIAHMGELERMTQYKDKTRGKGEAVTVGLFDYPVLMAADILLYETEIVPVGEDQKQHVELARDLAERFNKRFGETFTIPKPQIRKEGARIMGLDDPEIKMSKSAKSEKNFISLMDDDKTIEKKIKSAVTDSQGTIKYDEKRKGLANLITIYSLVTGQTNNQIEESYKGKGYKEFKEDLAKHLNDFLKPLQNKIKTYLSDETELKNILDQGAKKAQILAEQKMKDVRNKIGVY
ncbi:tryptophan--tRNA ligase [Candidatus Uhrbacteria bacterium]|nr:tryptophan--tRNA ligase [Candidatus Uhrbacteria bacterium]